MVLLKSPDKADDLNLSTIESKYYNFKQTGVSFSKRVGGGHPDPWWGEGGGCNLPKKFFGPFGPQFSLK